MMRVLTGVMIGILVLTTSLAARPSSKPQEPVAPRLIVTAHSFQSPFREPPLIYNDALYGCTKEGVFVKRNVFGQTEWEFSKAGMDCRRFIVQFNTVFILDKQGRLFCIDSKTGFFIWSAVSLHLKDIDFSPNGLLCLDDSGHALFLDINSGAVLWKNPGGFKSVYVDAVSKKLVASAGKKIVVLDADSGESFADDSLLPRSILNEKKPTSDTSLLTFTQNKFTLTLSENELTLADSRDSEKIGSWEIPTGYRSLTRQTLNFICEGRRIWLIHPEGVLEAELP
jgi:hypothetical protein